MAELTPKERLQPSLLDRLTDDAPDRHQESREQRVLTLSRLRQSVLRDMAWLLNTGSLDAVQDLEPFPEVGRSVLNFGVPDLSGATLSGIQLGELERRVRQAILDFEPRILKESLKVRAMASQSSMSLNAISFIIEGDLWAQPLPLHLYIRSELDLETGEVSVAESGGG
jgi:type VI secretion system protein ImpF